MRNLYAFTLFACMLHALSCSKATCEDACKILVARKYGDQPADVQKRWFDKTTAECRAEMSRPGAPVQIYQRILDCIVSAGVEDTEALKKCDRLRDDLEGH